MQTVRETCSFFSHSGGLQCSSRLSGPSLAVSAPVYPISDLFKLVPLRHRGMCAHITTEHLLTFFPLSGDDAVLFFRAHLLNDRCKFQCQFMKGGSHFCCDTLYLSLWKCGQAFSLFCPLYKNNVSVKVEFKNCCRYLFDGLCCQSAQHLKESRLKYLNSYWIDCCEILSRHPNDFVDPCFVFFLWHQENEMSNNFFVMMLHICHQVKICSLTLILIICTVVCDMCDFSVVWCNPVSKSPLQTPEVWAEHVPRAIIMQCSDDTDVL